MIEAIIGFVGVIVGALITWLQTLWSEHKKRRETRNYIAILIVFQLDRFIQGCVEVVLDGGILDNDGHLEPKTSGPKIDFETLKADWRVFPNHLIYEILDLPNKIETANHMISSAVEHSGPPDWDEVFEERQFQYSNLGIIANGLAKKLRDQNGLPNRDFNNWDPFDLLENKYQEIVSKRKKHELGILVQNRELDINSNN